MKFSALRDAIFGAINELGLTDSFETAISNEVNGKRYDPGHELDLLHSKLKEKKLSDKFVKEMLSNGVLNRANSLTGHYALLDFYLIFLGFKIPIGGVDWLKDDDDLLHWYKHRVHVTNYGKLAIKHKFGSAYLFKTQVAKACENWLFKKVIFSNHPNYLNDQQLLSLKKQISVIKNARLVLDLKLLKKIFEFDVKDFFYNTEIMDVISGYDFDIKIFEENLLKNIEFIGCEHRRRLDDCYELIFS